jgi:hypothetical protein
MKIKNLLIGLVFMLMVGTVQARGVYVAIMSEDLMTDIPNETSLKELVKANDQPLTQIFNDTSYVLSPEKVIVILGGNQSIRKELDNFKNKKIKYADSMVSLGVYICSPKKFLEKDQTYVVVRKLTKRPSYCSNLAFSEKKILVQAIIDDLLEKYK